MTVSSESLLVHSPPTAAPGANNSGECLEEVDPLGCPNWNEWTGSHPQACFFHSAEWARVLRQTYARLRPTSLVLHTGQERQAIVPLVEVDSGFGRRKGISLPFADFCEPLVWNAATWPALWQTLLTQGKAHQWQTLEIRGGKGWEAAAVPSLSFYGHLLDLRLGPDFLFQNLDPAIRRAIRKAEREGVTCEASESFSALCEYFRLHCLTRRKHGLPPQPFRFFRNIHEHVLARGHGFISLARYQGATIAGAVFFRFRDRALFKFGASDPRFQAVRGNNVVMWEAIRRLGREGMAFLHFGRTSRSNDGLRRFKRGWGAEEQVIHYFKFDLKKWAFVVDKDRTTGWHNKVFRAAPLWLARAVGSALYSRLA